VGNLKLSSRYQNKIVFCTIKGSTIKKFLIIDLITGTGIYYVLKVICSSLIISSIGSFIGAEGIKKYKNPNRIIAIKND